MNISLLKEYKFGDMIALYHIDEDSKNVELEIIPDNYKDRIVSNKKHSIDSLVQLKLAGDIYPGGYAGGNTMRQGESTIRLGYKQQDYFSFDDKKEVITVLEDSRGYIIEHHLIWFLNSQSIETYTSLENLSNDEISIEMISSFSLGGITPFVEKDAYDTLKVHRLRSVWSMEGRLESRSIEDLQLEPCWADHAIRAERFGQVGSMPVNRYFPYIAVEDSKNNIFWGAQLAHNASWQMELYRRDDCLAISGGLADREFGSWMKTLSKNEKFTTPKAIISVCGNGDIDKISQRLTSSIDRGVDEGPEVEQDLPIIFNEYCTTWGCPSHENISNIVEKIKDKGFTYFVIDCGWYKEKDVPWDISMGDYNPSEDLFSEGLEKTVDVIRKANLKPGIWFEIENVGSASKAYNEEAHLLKRDGKVLTTTMRRFWDMTDIWVEEYLTNKVIGTLKKYKFDYMKIDYNDTIGLGCDGAESLGEGLRKNAEASIKFLEKVKEEVPGIILENCASGGHKLEPLMMSLCSMASFSDAHECEEIPIIAANLHRAILPRQSQIWAVIRNTDSLKRIAYSIINTFLGRMCLSGDVLDLEKEKWDLIDKGIAFYKNISPIIKKGYTYRYGNEISSYRNPEGWQGILRIGENKEAVAIYHVFNGEVKEKLVIEIPEGYDFSISEVYSDTECDITYENNKLIYNASENMKAVAVYLK
jgi:Alpha-galactosidase